MTDDRGSATRHAAADLRRLRWLGFGLPILALVGLEGFRFLFVAADPLQHAEHVAIAAIAAIGILAFAALMFRLIDRAEAQVMRQNRELAAINAVSTAVQGELAVEQIIDAALDVVIERTGATEASVVVFNRQPSRQPAVERQVVRAPHASVGSTGEAMPHLVEIPLAHGAAIVGRMRLHMAENALEPDVLASATLNNIGHQLACSIEIGQLIGSLQRRESEDRGLYDVLLRISNQKALTETLAALAQHARDLLDADAVRICLTPSGALLVEQAGNTVNGGTIQRSDDGALTIVVGRNGTGEGAPPANGRSMRLPLVSPEMTFGDLCVTPSADGAIHEREWGFIHRIAELAVIAISNSRMREREREMAMLAERERIAREMHDSLAQVLGFIHLRLVDLRAKVARVDSPQMNASLDELTGVAEDAYRDVREAILGLHESSRAGRSLFENLRAYVERYEHQAGIDTKFETDFDRPPSLTPQAEIHVIRVIQEALTNVRKHAHARHAVVGATNDEGMVVFTVADDGRGFDLSTAALSHDGGFGLQAMRERMELIGGTLAIESSPRRGTRVIARVPQVPASTTVVEEPVIGAAV
jgi:two-component system nitrate/nitrite sensor histidine kinase NarX